MRGRYGAGVRREVASSKTKKLRPRFLTDPSGVAGIKARTKLAPTARVPALLVVGGPTPFRRGLHRCRLSSTESLQWLRRADQPAVLEYDDGEGCRRPVGPLQLAFLASLCKTPTPHPSLPGLGCLPASASSAC